VTTIINLYGGPGTGKSTSAAFIFYALKQQGFNSELVREYVKDWAWEGREISLYNQFYLMGKQIRKESMLYGKVDHIVTDSPVFLNIYYATKYLPPETAKGVVDAVGCYYGQAARDGHRHVHAFLRRSKPYNPAGRFQTHEEAREIDGELRKLLLSWPWIANGLKEYETDEFSLRQLVATITA
jgi:hypothetical protein